MNHNTSASNSTQSVPLWEILVPTVSNEGRPYRTRYHRVWDSKVKEIAHGLTVITPVRGTWVSPEGEEFQERMIPVRVRCSKEDIIRIAEISKVYYSQLAIMVYKVSDECLII